MTISTSVVSSGHKLIEILIDITAQQNFTFLVTLKLLLTKSGMLITKMSRSYEMYKLFVIVYVQVI